MDTIMTAYKALKAHVPTGGLEAVFRFMIGDTAGAKAAVWASIRKLLVMAAANFGKSIGGSVTARVGAVLGGIVADLLMSALDYYVCKGEASSYGVVELVL